jgi:methyltransferase-like protein/2-polyprenyl-3-methyl-5-hydroxy-6-metoxy-1,4-benzoquinol methylase
MQAAQTKTDTHQLIYDSFPYANTHPDKLFVLGTLFGLTPPVPQQANILEIGCASGGNCIPLALQYPNAHITGIDISEEEIMLGNQHINALSLDNITLKALSVTDLPENMGEFDYIICHGVFSWVGDKVREGILSCIQNKLSPNGLAYISYNTYPGWHQLESLRHMIRYHARGFPDIATQTDQAHALLSFLKQGVVNKQSAYADMLEKESTFIGSHPDSYIEQEYLGAYNTPFYFHEFAKQAEENHLAYVSDTSLHAMYLGHFPEEVRETLMTLGKDIIRFEQYIDFMTNRRFRNSILCHRNAGKGINRQLSPEALEAFAIRSLLTPDAASQASLQRQFRKDGKVVFATEDTVVSAMLEVLSEQKGKVLPVTELIQKTTFFLNAPANDKDDIRNTVLGSLLQLLIGDHIACYSMAPACGKSSTEMPCTPTLARYQAASQDWVTNQFHEKISIGEMEQQLIPLMDGTRPIESIIEAFIDNFVQTKANTGDIVHLKENQGTIEKELRTITHSTIASLRRNGLLVK